MCTGSEAWDGRMTVHPLIVSVSATLRSASLGALAVIEAMNAVHSCASDFERVHWGQPVDSVERLASDPQRTHPGWLGPLRRVGSLVDARRACRHRPGGSRKQCRYGQSGRNPWCSSAHLPLPSSSVTRH
jgi:hypothetical protein